MRREEAKQEKDLQRFLGKRQTLRYNNSRDRHIVTTLEGRALNPALILKCRWDILNANKSNNRYTTDTLWKS